MWLRKWIAVALILACAACASAARLAWDANQDDGLTVGYKIYYGLSSRQYSNSVDVGNLTEWTIPEWPRDVDYYFAATAYDNDANESGYSNEAIYYRETPGVPSPATDVRVVFEPREQEPPMAIDLTLEYTVNVFTDRTNSTLDKPANTADGDFLIAVIYQGVYQYDITPPSGWTQIAQVTHSEADRGRITVFYKRAASEGASWTWTHSYGASCGVVKRFTGVIATGDPEDVTESTGETAYSPDAVSCASITTATDGAALIQFAGIVAGDFTTHALTNRVRINGETPYSSDFVFDADLQATAGATGAKAIGKNDYSRALAILIALKPAAAASGSIVPILLNQYRARRQ